MEIEIIRFAEPVPYREGYTAQIARRNAVERGEASPALFLLEHTPTITIGRSGGRQHVLLDGAALEAHYAREESLYYPSIWALRPDQKPALLDLIGSHNEFRAQLDAIAGDLEAGALHEAERHLEEFAEVFGYHESAEEKLLHLLEREIRGLP